MVSPLFFLAAILQGATPGATLQVVPDGEAQALANKALIALVALLMSLATYFLKQVADDVKTTRTTVEKHGVLLARHDVMYDVWIDELANGSPDEGETPRRRRSDLLKELLSGASKPREETS